VTFAHVAGVPIEEGLLALAPAASALAILVRTRLHRIGRSHRADGEEVPRE
jgi:hypothetical protein